jgi:hypothetical protein
MTAELDVAGPRVTIDDLRHRADDVKKKAVAEAKDAVDTVVGDNTRAILVVAGVVLVVASVAYYLGTRAVRYPSIEDLLGE